MKKLAQLLVGLPLLALPLASTASDRLDLSDPADAFEVWAKMNCNLEEGKPVLWWWHGKMYSRRSGEKDRHLFNVHGMNIRNCQYHREGERAPGIRWTSREVMLYLDPETNEVVDQWENPFTGETVDVVHVANDPVNIRGVLWSRNDNGDFRGIGTDLMQVGDTIMEGGGAATLFYENPLGGDYQEYIGGTYHAMEYGSFSVNTDEALSTDNTTIEDVNLSWGRISKWLPWMEMGDREGVVVFHTAGMRLSEWDDMPAVIREEIEENYPIYREPPPIDDPRIKETSWTVFKRHLAEKEAANSEPEAH